VITDSAGCIKSESDLYPEAQNSIMKDIRKAAERLKAIRQEQARRAAASE